MDFLTIIMEVKDMDNITLDELMRSLTSYEELKEWKDKIKIEENEVASKCLVAMIDEPSEPKLVNAFQRVKFAERLENNSYWVEDGTDVGYSAKAQVVPGQAKGRAFHHEKTRGYRSGHIDLHYEVLGALKCGTNFI